MKTLGYAFMIFALLAVFSCEEKEEEVSEVFTMLTAHPWASDSLLIDGQDASGPGGLLEKFKGDMVLNEDGTGLFGGYTGTWKLSANEKELTLNTEALPTVLNPKIEELTNSSLKITTGFPVSAEVELKVRLTFKAK
jgi:hypothetical protein